MHKSNYLPTEEDEKNIDNSNFIQNNRYNTCGNESELEKTKQFKNFKSQKLIRPYHRKKNFKDIYGYENIYKYKTKPERWFSHEDISFLSTLSLLSASVPSVDPFSLCVIGGSVLHVG